MSGIIHGCSGLLQFNHAEIQRKIVHRKLFGLDELQNYLFRFCKAILTADASMLSYFSLYDLAPSVLLYGPPNTGKTSLCYFLFDQIKQEVTNEINFYTVNIGRMLDPALGQSSRNLEQIFQELRKICLDGTSVFLLLDELDTFCMSRSRAQEHDAVRRAMATLMLELDQLNSATNQRFLLFGITNVPQLLDTAVVRRFSLKRSVDSSLSREEFKLYVDYLNQPLKVTLTEKEADKLYAIYQQREFTVGDIKSLYKDLLVDKLCADSSIYMQERLVEVFEKGFSTHQHLKDVFKELSND
ncbi:ATP-binding protein [Iningainema tapete]|uniref:AAA family ATPase n=1 Tax=Iningainema tapete BLCC-T55 TaxID=2748662 RepID=A0A8J7CA64_9CYAN|nr:ATP-binding protein [Iningainema tapete]MBD2778964.1 AAA family ATPase [Iningainema tapete BLCC-T55]